MFAEDAERDRLRVRRVMRIVRAIKDNEDEEEPKRRGGSVPIHLVIERNHAEGHGRHIADYIVPNPGYPEYLFRRRFRMSSDLFKKIVEDLGNKHWYFTQRLDAKKKSGLSAHQKATAAIRQLAYGTSADSVDEYVGIGGSTALESLKYFYEAIITMYGAEYLRASNEEDIRRILSHNEERGFPGMLGSLDCLHWKWKNCPTAWKGQYQGKEKIATVILEVVADYETWIWHAFFGLPGSLNDISVLKYSPLFRAVASGEMPEIKFTTNGNEYDKGYYLVDGIYPPYAMFIDTIPYPVDKKK